MGVDVRKGGLKCVLKVGGRRLVRAHMNPPFGYHVVARRTDGTPEPGRRHGKSGSRCISNGLVIRRIHALGSSVAENRNAQ